MLRDWEKKVKRVRSTSWQLQTSLRDVKQSIGNIVHNIVKTMCEASWVLETPGGTWQGWGGHYVKFTIV